MLIGANQVDWDAFEICHVPANPEPFRLINRIPIRESGEPLVDLRETNPELSFGVYCLPFVRESIAEALTIAHEATPAHLDLRVFTALRTLEQQAEMYWHNYRKAKEEHPNWPESVLRKMTNRFFAPPDAKAPPGHCTGGAVDVGLIDRETGEGLDLRSPLEGWLGAPTGVAGLHPDAAENRRLLCYIMHAAGFSNCRDEFWHWSYGDSAWAVRVGAEYACYGLIEAPAGANRVTGPRIALASYRQEWEDQFLEIEREIQSKLPRLLAAVEHVGGTSVPGMAAEPVLDVEVVLRSEEDRNAVVEGLQGLGYVSEGDLEIGQRQAFRADKEPAKQWPAHRLSASVQGNPELVRRLAFRDYLRRNSVASEAFTQLKAELAARYPWDRTRYGEGKTNFVDSVLTGI